MRLNNPVHTDAGLVDSTGSKSEQGGCFLRRDVYGCPTFLVYGCPTFLVTILIRELAVRCGQIF